MKGVGGIVHNALGQRPHPQKGRVQVGTSCATAGRHSLKMDPTKPCLSFPWAEHQLSKPDVVSQLEEEELWSVERGVPQDTFSGENQARGCLGRKRADWSVRNWSLRKVGWGNPQVGCWAA